MENSSKIVLVNKPKGITSFDVIRIMRKVLGIKKIGHAGTLDPNATGLMILGINEGTKELSSLILNDKTYEATILLGTKTDSGDIDGNVLVKKEPKIFVDNEIIKAVEKTLGTNNYPVPIYSALKINGKKMYELARSGTPVEPKIKEMTVYNISNIKYEHPFILATFSVSKGTYIRSLVEYIGNVLGQPSTLAGLNRISIGKYNLSDAINLPQKEVEKHLIKKHH